MADTLRDRIIAALLSEDDVALMADAVIRELEADYVLVPKSHTLSRVARKDFLIAQAEAELRRMKGADDD